MCSVQGSLLLQDAFVMLTAITDKPSIVTFTPSTSDWLIKYCRRPNEGSRIKQKDITINAILSDRYFRKGYILPDKASDTRLQGTTILVNQGRNLTH